ncbi:Hypothetical predicted protein [Olea europaea subsp. europaea]|uniref:Uncharacterized protein n=1 Tax=Olea europaea subsp. europaea TaxID=158383 RepID=A0A8S0RL91_OLEEU|nr:Hypothetical predicted protein [Olea europaea subsp. europaea]
MARNGGAQEMWCPITSTVNATCRKAVPVQESLWKSKTRRKTLFCLILKLIQVFLHPLVRNMKGGMDAGQKWQHLVDASIGFGDEGSIYSSIASVFHRDYVQQQPLNMFQASEDVFKCIRGGESNIGAFYNPDLVFLDKQPRGLIDENGYFESSVSSEHGNLSTCSLDLSMVMGAGNVLDEEMRENQEEFGVEDSRLLRPVSWMSFAQGGPLAEALRPGSVAGGGGSIPGSPYDSISTTATTVSSPSGVLHWTLLSHSDSSVCNSPTTLAAATAPSQKPAKFLEN